jgi:ATP-dependent DNA helicase RecG
MMIEGAERFGLAQLYQFRGRVGRGEYQSHCFLFTDSKTTDTKKRLSAIVNARNGLELAEKDLTLRGPGELFGTSQTGMPDLAMKALQNPDLMKTAYAEAKDLIKKDPNLTKNPLIGERVKHFASHIHWE